MKTVSIDELFSEESGMCSMNFTLIGLLMLVIFATRIWGDLLYKILAKVLGGKRTIEQLLFLSIVMVIVVYTFARVCEIGD